MKKWVKRLLIGLAAVVVVIVLLLVAALIWINQIVKVGIETGGTYALGVPTTLKSVDIGVFSGKAGISQLEVANPAGFKTPHFLALQSAKVEVSLGSLTKDLIEIPRLELTGIDINLEKNQDGQANYAIILANLKKLQSGAAQPTEQKPAKPGKKLVIRELVLKNVSVLAEMPLTGASVPVQVDQIVLHNVGSDGRMDMSEVTGVVVQATLAAALAAGGGILPKDIAGDLSQGLGGLKSLASSGIQVAGDMGKAIGDMGSGAAQAISGAADTAGKAVDDIGKGLGDLFGGKKDAQKK